MSDKEIKRPSYNAVITAEYRLLNALAKNETYRNDARVNENLFVDEVAKSIYEAITRLDDAHIEVTPASLHQAGSEIDFNVTRPVIDAIYNVDEGSVSSIDDMVASLKNAQQKDKLLGMVENVKQILSAPGEVKSADVLEKLYSMDEYILKSGKSESSLLSFSEWSDIYIDDLKERKLGRKYSYGDMFLDQYFVKGAYPGAITTVAASTSMGKSTYVLSLIDNLLERNVPCMYISLEMGKIDTYDRLISSRLAIDNEELYNPGAIDEIIEKVEEEKKALENRKNFYFCEDPDIDLIKLRSLIREFKQKTHNDYAFVAIDLLTQMKNFMSSTNGSSTATAMEIGMNKLNALAKEENVHILAVVQFKRDSDSIKIHSVEEIDLLRPSLTDIKNSGAIAERSRVVLSVFRKKYYADRYLVPFNVPGAEDIEDVMEVQVLKNSNGQGAGKIFKYMFDVEHFKLLPVEDADVVKMGSIEDALDIDY